jgi:ParB-like chromosome segregation protein Spo0J
MTTIKDALKIVQIPIAELRPSLYNPRKWSEDSTEQLKESVRRFGLVDPILVNGAPKRQNIVIGGHFRLKVA